jgi:hypothetical protein
MTKDEYEEYRQSRHWIELSRAVRQADKVCQRCGFPYELNVHHKTYERLGHEDLKDLILLCRSCHAREHFLEELHDSPVLEALIGRDSNARYRIEQQQKVAKKKNVERGDEVRENIRKQKDEDY